MTVAGKRYVDCTVLGTGNSAEAEDSSYDSDYDAEDLLESSGVHPRLEEQVSSDSHSSSHPHLHTRTQLYSHPDISRTTSDTLAAEFAEYVTVQGPLTTDNPGYTARVEFALKLGYTEQLVQAALQKLGPNPGQNELLAELIKLGANSSSKLNDDLEESEGIPEGVSHTRVTEDNTAVKCNAKLRPIVIDGSNVAMSHGNKKIFSCRGIKICVDWFQTRGHKEITVFVPKWRKEAARIDNPITDQEILSELERDRLLVFTPSRLVGGKRMVCYDDRYILKLAAEMDGIVVSNDNYRDLAQENPEFKRVVEERILMYSFVNDRFMPPDDPLGRSGPTLENFLRVVPRVTDPAPPCPYGKKCTYGNKCKYRHPERGPHPQKSVTERLVEHAQRHLQARGPSLSLPLSTSSGLPPSQHQSVCKTKSAVLPSSFHQTLSSVPKSRSVENVTSDTSAINSTVHQLNSFSLQNDSSSKCGCSARRTKSNTVNSNPEPSVNMHKKLQRQLTLNPMSDPRIYQLKSFQQQRKYENKPKHRRKEEKDDRTEQKETDEREEREDQEMLKNQPLHSQLPSPGTQYMHPAVFGPSHMRIQHGMLSRPMSNSILYPSAINWQHQDRLQQHQQVTRIASAPDSYRGWHPQTNNLNGPLRIDRIGNSDPQLNILPPALPATSHLQSPWNTQKSDTRNRLHYHLTNIFPEEQVQAAMIMHPYETDPQQICAAILSMFPKT